VATAVEYGLARRRLDGVSAIGVDEVVWRKGHKYVTLVWQLNGARRLLWVGQDRTMKAFEGFFDKMEKLREGFCGSVKFICSDMWRPYLNVARKRIPDAVHILDRFHVMQKFSKAMDRLRAEEARRLKAKGLAFILKHARWCLLKRPSNLTEKECFKLRELLKMNLPLVRFYLLREQFQCFWEYVSPAWAGKFLDTWCDKAKRSKIGEAKTIANTLQRHRELLLNWFRARKQYNNGIVEGLNHKVNTTVRRGFGYRSYEVFEMVLYHQFGDLPEQEFTHNFW
jgi:transposase